MSDRMRQGRERLLWADDAMVAVRLPKVELSQIPNTPSQIPNTPSQMQNTPSQIPIVSNMLAPWMGEPDSYPLEVFLIIKFNQYLLCLFSCPCSSIPTLADSVTD